jgi:uncharacterized protein with GYD domain
MAAPDGLTIGRRAGWLPGAHTDTRASPNAEGNAMATYVSLLNFTEKGVREIKETLKRTEAAKSAAKQLGATIKEVLWLQGQYDVVVIIEASDEIAVTALLLNTLKAGNVRAQTMRAFTAGEMGKILEKVT